MKRNKNYKALYNSIKVKRTYLTDEDMECITSYLEEDDQLEDDYAILVETDRLLYSKIVVQFNSEDSYMQFEDDEPDTDAYLICHEYDTDNLIFIGYSLDESALEDINEVMSEYDCSIVEYK
jgi:hypothetical protein